MKNPAGTQRLGSNDVVAARDRAAANVPSTREAQVLDGPRGPARSFPAKDLARRGRTLALGAAALAVAGAGCTIIIQPGGGGPDGPPIPFPLTCTPAPEQPVVHLYFDVRVERSTVNLADRYSGFMERVVVGLAGAGVHPGQAVLLRADERPGATPLLAAWGCSLDSPQDLPPETVLRHYAQNEPLAEAPLGCVTDTLTNVGANIADVVTQYPPALRGTSGLSVFGAAPDVALVVHIDALARRSGFDETACRSAGVLAEVEADGTARWIRYAGPDLPPQRIVHWFVNTPEGVDRATFVAECKKLEGFPSSSLDLIEPSAKAFYEPLSQRLASAGAQVAHLPLCQMLSDDVDWLVREIASVGDLAGADVDEDRVRAAIAGGFPALLEGAEPGGSITLPGGR